MNKTYEVTIIADGVSQVDAARLAGSITTKYLELDGNLTVEIRERENENE